MGSISVAKASVKKCCPTCENFARFERAAPKGQFFMCPQCGKRFERVKADAAADVLLDKLLLPPASNGKRK